MQCLKQKELKQLFKMKKEIVDLLGNPIAFLAGAAIGYYYSEHKMASPTTTKKWVAVVGCGLVAHFIYKKVTDKGISGIYVEPNIAPVKGIKQTK